MTVQRNIQSFKDAKAEVLAHCMCFRFEDVGGKFRVIYPDGYFPNGVQVSKAMGKTKALQRLIEVMERHWKESLL